eukprot:TRINITY_DN1510_c0_g1_i1.p1 TRINITY_DN1510_c0_g1~~TRINITY_DN1510_c0_g1_i1.p1  ORF type:complete len:259 (+),score=60.10 TRINITY_DN1510_c0_g1_i1:121-897(+)
MPLSEDAMEESRRQAAIQLGMTPDQVRELEKQAVQPGQEAPEGRPVVPDAAPLPSGDTGWYRWRQTASEVEVLVPIEDHVKSQDIAWSITKTHITFGVAGREALKNARLAHSVNVSEGHTWQIDYDEGRRCVVATIEKRKLHEKWLSVEATNGAGSVPNGAVQEEADSVRPSRPQTSNGYTNGSSIQLLAEQAQLDTVSDELKAVESQLAKLQERRDALKEQQERLQASVAREKIAETLAETQKYLGTGRDAWSAWRC